jgi:cyclopropane fatty-acyl-phospholipid synthase-like methyltransferase
MSTREAEHMFNGVGNLLRPGGRFCLYGPFNYHGQYSSESNARFDQWLKQRDPDSGIKDLDDLIQWAEQSGLTLANDYEMPVNNRILVWVKQ